MRGGVRWVWSPAGWHAVCNSWALPRCFVASRSEFGTSAGQVPPEEEAEEAAEAAAEEEELLLRCMHLSRCAALRLSSPQCPPPSARNPRPGRICPPVAFRSRHRRSLDGSWPLSAGSAPPAPTDTTDQTQMAEYVERHAIAATLTAAVNDTISKLPDNPYGAMVRCSSSPG